MPEKYECDECDFVAKADNPVASLRMHIARKHRAMGPGNGKRKSYRRKTSTALVPVTTAVPENTIRIMKNLEVVTDGKKIGIVEWIR